MNIRQKILLIESSRESYTFLSAFLARNGYQVTHAHTASEGLHLSVSLRPEIILLDLELPHANSCDLLRALRSGSTVPIIAAAPSSASENDIVHALDMGADDYVVKPFSSTELMARIRICLRRSRYFGPISIYSSKDLKIDFERRSITLAGEGIHLTQIEYQLLTLLAANSGRVLTYNFIMNTIWGLYGNNNQILRVNMANIRRKIEKNSSRPEYVFTEIGVGYRMPENESRREFTLPPSVYQTS